MILHGKANDHKQLSLKSFTLTLGVVYLCFTLLLTHSIKKVCVHVDTYLHICTHIYA